MSDALRPLGDAGPERSARAVVQALGLAAPAAGDRPRVVAAMIVSLDGRAAVDGSSAPLGHPADRALLRELRSAVDAILVGPGTLRAERYAQLLDPEQRERRVARGRPPQPVVVTVTRSGEVPVEIPLFAEPDATIQVYTESDVRLDGVEAEVAVERLGPGEATPGSVLRHLGARRGVRSVLCEGGPTLLRALLAERCVDDLSLTLSPLVVGGEEPAAVHGDPIRPPAAFALAGVHRADGHLLMHYVLAS